MLSLVTGGAGLLGSCLAAVLRDRGEAVRVVDRVRPRAGGEADPGLEVRVGDLCDPAVADAACRGVEVVYHAAALQRMKADGALPSERAVFAANVAATENVLRAAERAGVRKVVYVSSSGVYGLPRRLPVDEDHPLAPIGAYGRSKVRCEELCRAALARGLDVAVVRPVSLFGPGMKGVFLMLFEWVRTGRPVYLMGRGENRVEMASAWDVAEACRLAAERPQSRGQAFNVGSAGVPTARAQVEALIAHAGSRSRVVPLPAGALRAAARVLHLARLSPLVPEHYLLADREFLLDQRRARGLLGWAPRYTNERMTADAYDWYVGSPARGTERHPVLRLLGLAAEP